MGHWLFSIFYWSHFPIPNPSNDQLQLDSALEFLWKWFFVFSNQYLFVFSLHFIHTHLLTPLLNILPQNYIEKPFWLIISILVWPQSSTVSLVPNVRYPSFLIFLPPEGNCISHFTWTWCQLCFFIIKKTKLHKAYYPRL